jgi:hypothetical protein
LIELLDKREDFLGETAHHSIFNAIKHGLALFHTPDAARSLLEALVALVIDRFTVRKFAVEFLSQLGAHHGRLS